jgi:translation initiation factor 1
MIEDTCSVCGLPKELCVCSDVEKGNSVIQIKTEKRKYGKLWAIVTGIEASSPELKSILKQIKTKMACGGTIKGKSIEILYGRTERNKELINVLEGLGFNRDSIHISGK